MKKRIIVLAMVVCMALTACGGSKKDKELDSELTALQEEMESEMSEDESETGDAQEQYNYSDRNPDGSVNNDENSKEPFTEENVTFPSGMIFDYSYFSNIYKSSTEMDYIQKVYDNGKNLEFGLLNKSRTWVESGISYSETSTDGVYEEEMPNIYQHHKEYYSVDDYKNGNFHTFSENENYYFGFELCSYENGNELRINIFQKKYTTPIYQNYFEYKLGDPFDETIFNELMAQLKGFYGDFSHPTYENIVNATM